MSLRLRLSLILAAVVIATLLAAWLIAGRAVIRPFADEVLEGYLGEAVFLAGRIEAGESPEALSKKLGLQIRVEDQPPFHPSRRRPFRRHACRRTVRDDRELIVCRGPRAPVSVKTNIGWVNVRRDLDLGAPGRKIGEFLIFLSLAILALSTYLAFIATKPLSSTEDAIAKVAAGDLEHRLPVTGPKELQQLAQTFNRMTERMREMLEAERSLMAGISHELRTPLARLRLEIELLRESGLESKRLDAMEADLEGIDRLIGELLEISRLSIGERHLSKQRLTLRSVAEEAAKRSAITTHRVQIEGDGATLEGDFEKLVRVVTNLLSNASKYAPPGTTIQIAVDENGLSVVDEGPGVAPEALPRLFEPFYRAGHSSRAGSGLGLMIAQQVISLHGGTIRAENRPQGGFSVGFVLPGTLTR